MTCSKYVGIINIKSYLIYDLVGGGFCQDDFA